MTVHYLIILAEILRKVNEECNDIRNNLIKYARNCNLLILWLDCDREGEAIAFEVVDLVKSINPCVQILRAHFSALTFTEISRAISNLVPPNKNLADAVEIRQRIDLLIGATFTRLQTLSFKSIFYNNNGSNEIGNKYVIR
jgi:DNA topoisomerase-3